MRCRAYIAIIVFFMGTGFSRADIIWEQSDYVLGTKFDEGYVELDIDGNGSADFSLNTGGLLASAGIKRKGENRYVIHPSSPPNIGGNVAALNSGYVIGPNGILDSSDAWFGIDNDWGILMLALDSGVVGEFYHTRGYVGLEYQAEDGVHYGWLDIEGATSSVETPLIGDSSLIIHGWAYESEPGEAIVAGAIPEPSSVILLLVGGMGIWMMRRRRFR